MAEPIDIHDAKRMMDTEAVILVDIRDPQSYESGHIPNAVLVNQSNIDSFLKNFDPTTPLICYCYHGISSRQAADYFQQAGFQKVYSVNGGFEEWKTVYPISQEKENPAS